MLSYTVVAPAWWFGGGLGLVLSWSDKPSGMGEQGRGFSGRYGVSS